MESQIQENKSFKNLIWGEKETWNKEFENCSFISCDFSSALFTSCKFVDCAFTSCNLSMAKLKSCQLNSVYFKDCKLLGVNFNECIDILFTVKFEGCVLDYCSFVKKKMLKTSFRNSSVKNVDFSESDLSKSLFLNVDLLSSIFNKTILKEVNFLTASNYNIDPEMNNIKKAKFSISGLAGLLNKYDIEIE